MSEQNASSTSASAVPSARTAKPCGRPIRLVGRLARDRGRCARRHASRPGGVGPDRLLADERKRGDEQRPPWTAGSSRDGACTRGVRATLASVTLLDALGPVSAFAEFVELGGYTVGGDGDDVEVWSRGGEERHRIRASDSGYLVAGASRSESYVTELQASRLEDVERYLTFLIGNASIRGMRGHGLLATSTQVAPAAGTASATDGEGNVRLWSVAYPSRTVTFLRGVPWESRTFSHLMGVPLGILRRALLDAHGSPVFDVAQPQASPPAVLPWSPAWLFSTAFREFVALGGAEVTARGDTVHVGDEEAGYDVSDTDGWWRVRRYSRGLHDTTLRARRAEDVERYLLLKLGPAARHAPQLMLPLLVEPTPPAEIAHGLRFESVAPGWVSVRGADDSERGIEIADAGIIAARDARDLTHLLSATLPDIRESYLDATGSPALTPVCVPVSPHVSAPPVVAWAELSPSDRRLADAGFRLFCSLSAQSGKAFGDPVSAVPFDAGVAVFRAIRGGGMILVAHDESVLYRSSSYSFERALAEFRAGARTPRVSFGS
ncbi:Imm61 family immunity protein [Microbacterium sp. NPDC089189]|uniref:Imm61 family immunity protein n=1 Tax=Microbacterium sp. NPDC089189 TaxID=3154972 RepID=UPI003432BF61